MSVHQADQTEEEKVLFKAFLEATPAFADEEIAQWSSTGCSCDPPDVICTTVAGKRVGVEVCQWINEKEMNSGKLRERINKTLLKAIGPQPVNKSEHFRLVVFHPRIKSQLSAADHKAFRTALFALIKYVDREWPKISRPGQPYRFCNLSSYAPLNDHLEIVTFCPPDSDLDAAVNKAMETCGNDAAISQTETESSEDSPISDWIVPVSPWQSIRTPYAAEQWEPDECGKPVTVEGYLVKKLKDKADRCSESKLKTPCTEVHLLIALHQAIPYCSPIPFKMQDIAQQAVDRARRSTSWPFRCTFLLIAVEDEPKVHRLL